MKLHINQSIEQIMNSNRLALEKTWDHEYDKIEKDELLKNIYTDAIKDLDQTDQQRIINELEKLGPIENAITDPEITEILVNRYNQVIFEKNGQLILTNDFFFSRETYHDCIERLCQMCGSFINKEKPFIETQIGKLRITIIYGDLASGSHLLSIRKQSENKITLEKLKSWNWCSHDEYQVLKKIISNKENFIVAGGTSSGKTTVLQA